MFCVLKSVRGHFVKNAKQKTNNPSLIGYGKRNDRKLERRRQGAEGRQYNVIKMIYYKYIYIYINISEGPFGTMSRHVLR